MALGRQPVPRPAGGPAVTWRSGRRLSQRRAGAGQQYCDGSEQSFAHGLPFFLDLGPRYYRLRAAPAYHKTLRRVIKYPTLRGLTGYSGNADFRRFASGND